MKLTDFALIFVAVFLPVMLIVYINTSFVVKAEKQEMYYKSIINSAVSDAVSSMKQVENEDQDVDYGYSGIVDNKVSINADVAVSTFYNSLANNFNIKDNPSSMYNLKMYTPVVAVLDYDGIYIHSAEKNESGDITFVTKPKVYYTYTYVITRKSSVIIGQRDNYLVTALDTTQDIDSIRDKLITHCIYEVTFTMDDYVYLNVYSITRDNKIGEVLSSTKFYLTDDENNQNLVYIYRNDHKNYILTSDEQQNLKANIIDKLKSSRQDVIAKIGMKEISYAVNKHNVFAESAGINYTFRFSVESDSAWYETMDGIGMIAVIQGISLGNRYLNYKAYSTSDLVMTKKYYVTEGITIDGRELSYFEKDLYHISKGCLVYQEYMNKTGKILIPEYYTKKADAATQGFHPCPICKP